MAIKGKSKSRSSKAVTRGPKPVYQPVKKPFLARRGLWLVLAGVFGTVVVIGLIAGFIAQRTAGNQEALEQRMGDAIAQYQGELEPILASVGQPVPPLGYQAFAALDQAVSGLENESLEAPADPEALKTTADETIASAKAALEALQGIDELELIQGKGFSEEFVLYVINSKGNLIRSMFLFRETAEIVKLAADAEGPTRAALVGRARSVLDVASEIFGRGYSDYVEAQSKARIFEPGSDGVSITTGS
ncbi:MAG: hypothetical protein WD670_08445 [Actinomycetota bacterium]